jgi:hypothetical protein
MQRMRIPTAARAASPISAYVAQGVAKLFAMDEQSTWRSVYCSLNSFQASGHNSATLGRGSVGVFAHRRLRLVATHGNEAFIRLENCLQLCALTPDQSAMR